MVDYSRFDHIDTDDDEEPTINVAAPRIHPQAMPSDANIPQKLVKKGKEGRIQFEYEGRTIYEWEQGLEEVNIYIEPPPGVTRQHLVITITPTHLAVGLRGAPAFLDEDLGGHVVPDESTWTYIDGEIQIILQKMRKAEAWDCALQGRAGSKLDAYTKEEVRKKLMLERFQEEHPGFDFSGADFNGTVPDAREFMGGVKYG